jgi:predicted nucleotidyltransferase component of viral defense system
MITEAEIRRLAARWQTDPMILDLDYSLGWFLAALFATPRASQKLCFKGGTCLRKCYFRGYRFSEDLDFTARSYVSPDDITDWVGQTVGWSVDRGGPDFLAGPYRFETVEDEYGKETYQIRVYFRGPLRWGGSPRAIRLDVTGDEILLLPTVSRSIIQPYSDSDEFSGVKVSCYSLLEILSEKVRAICGQRRFAISRDLYDIHRLVQSGLLVQDLVPLLADKFQSRGVDISLLEVSLLERRRREYELDWIRNLDYLIPDSDVVTFEEAWQSTIRMISQAQRMINW